MGFLKKSKVPGELPDLVIGDSNNRLVSSGPAESSLPNNLPIQNEQPRLISSPEPVAQQPQKVEVQRREIAGEDYLEFSNVPESKQHSEIKKVIDETIAKDKNSFFDKMLEDINGEIQDLGKLEEWYKNKFLPQDVVSNMRDYWENNKADMIIKSFGSEYKEKINEKIKRLQDLEGDWREIYFKLIKKEEEMKKEERLLKETLSEFVELCKRRRLDGEKKE